MATGSTRLGRIKLESPEIPVLMLSTYDNPTYVARAVALGAAGYVLKGADREELLDAIRKAAAGESCLDPRRAAPRDRRAGHAAVDRRRRSAADPARERSPAAAGLGLTNKEIAQALHISYETVKEHVQHILRKIGVSDRTQAAVWAVRKGLV